MPYLDKIPLAKIKVIPNIQNATVGALLQIAPYAPSENGPPSVAVLRCIMAAVGAVSNGVVFLEGALAGTFVVDEELSHRPALDIRACLKRLLHSRGLHDSPLRRQLIW